MLSYELESINIIKQPEMHISSNYNRFMLTFRSTRV
jgi:hypothetical protein